MSDQASADDAREEIAIVGMAGRFPGADDIQQLWGNLRDGAEAIRRFTDDELSASGVTLADRSDPTWVNAGAVLSDPDGFDAEFFGMDPREAELTDPQHRVFLECAWAALEHSGHDPASFDGLISLFGGVAANTYLRHLLVTQPEEIGAVGGYPMLLAGEREYAVTRAAFKLGLRGPAVHVSTACSTSAVAIHLAAQSLLAGESDLALAGGARLRVPLHAGYLYEEGGILAPDGVCRPFDVDARGTVAASGAAFVVLRRLSDALADGDHVYGLLKGSAINNDGSDKVGFTAPSASGQAAVIRQALAVAEVDARSIDYVEAHGTGTRLGDPIEISGLTKAFRADSSDTGWCRIGSLKSNLGHLDAAAGVAGVIKVLLSMAAGQIPASLHFRQPNPELALDTSPFVVADRLVQWPQPRDRPRRAGVSSFGLGGTNAHLVLEQWSATPTVGTPENAPGSSELLLLSARTAEGLDVATQRLGEFLAGAPELGIDDVAHTLRVGRRAFTYRRSVLAGDTSSAAVALLATQQAATRAADVAARVGFLLPGGGSQHVDMARGLYAAEPGFREELDACVQICSDLTGHDLLQWILPSDTDRNVAEPVLAGVQWGLPSLFAVEHALAQWWIRRGVRPTLLLGHSLGEYVAACLAGVFSLEDALRVVIARSELMAAAPRGAMLSVALGVDEVGAYLVPGLDVSAVNAADSCVLGGPVDVIAAVDRRLQDDDVETHRVAIEVASHSALMSPVATALVDVMRTVRLSTPHVPVVSNLTGTWLTDEQALDPGYWGEHLQRTVRFADCLMTTATSADLLLEVGPGQTLSSYARAAFQDGGPRVVASMRHRAQEADDSAVLRQAAGRLWEAGVVGLDLTPARKRREPRRVGLPTYAFQRRRYWVGDAPRDDSVPAAARPTATPAPTAPGTPAVVPESAGSIATAAVDPLTWATEGICEILARLSGREVGVQDRDTRFLDLGFDSLFLTQANTAFRKAFGVRITFRQLFEQAPTVNSLAAYVAERASPPAPPPPASTDQTAETPVPAGSGADAVSSAPRPDVVGSTAERLIAEQLRIMAMQLQVLGGGAVPPVAGAGLDPGGSLTVGAETGHQPDRTSVAPAETAAPQVGLRGTPPDDRARAAIEELVRRYGARTRRSRELADLWRPHMADNRTIVGFDRAWKDLVYQIVAERSDGARIWDVDGNELVDTALGFGSIMLGHSHPEVVRAVQAQIERGFAVGVQSDLLGDVSARILAMSGQERLTYCHSGGEAVETAIRIARTVTGRDEVVYFTDDVHGRADIVLGRRVGNGPEARTMPAVAGVPQHVVDDAYVLDYGSAEALERIASQAGQLAAVVVEPVRTRNPDLQPVDFLRQIRSLADQHGFLLVMDEVVTGFRAHQRGVQGLWGIPADLTTFGKVLGGGMPIGVVAGRADHVDVVDGGPWRFGDDSFPAADITGSGGTMIKHPVSLAATSAVLDVLEREGGGLQDQLTRTTHALVDDINDHLVRHGIPIHVQQFSSFFRPTFLDERRYEGLFQYFLRERGVHLNPPSPSFLSTAHGERDVAAVAEAYKGAADEMARVGLLEHRPPAHGPSAGVARPSDEADMLPLLPNAVRFLEERRSEGLHHWNVGGLLQVTRRIDVAALRAAVGAVLERHDALRMRFRQRPDGHWQAHVASVDGHIPLDLVDLAALPAEEQDRELALGNDLAQAGLDLSRGPLVALRLIDLGGRGQRLHVFMHHLVMDGLSWRPFWRDLLTAYNQRVTAAPLDLGPASTSFGHWARGLQEWAGAAPAAEVDRWINQDWTSVRALPVDLDGGPDATANTNESARTVVVELTAGETHTLLHETPAVPNKVDLLLTALAGALAGWTGSSTVLIDMMGHGRDEDLVPDADLFDTVGFFISYTPMVLTVDDPAAPAVLTEQIHGALRGGAGFDVLRTMSPDERVRESLDALPRADVLFNYLGRRSRLDTTPEQPDPPLLAATQEPAGRTHHPRGLRYYPLSVSAEVWAGQLRVTLVYSQNVHRRETVEALAEDVRKGLLRYI